MAAISRSALDAAAAGTPFGDGLLDEFLANTLDGAPAIQEGGGALRAARQGPEGRWRLRSSLSTLGPNAQVLAEGVAARQRAHEVRRASAAQAFREALRALRGATEVRELSDH